MFSVSLEVFPPKDVEGLDYKLSALLGVLDNYRVINIDYISVTYGANGGNRKNAFAVAKGLRKMGYEVVSHITCTNTTKDGIESLLSEAYQSGVRHILALRGDPVPGSLIESYYEHTTDLLKGESKRLENFNVGVACYPELFRGAHNIREEVKYLKQKQDLGAKYAITQVFFDNSYYYTFVRYAREAGVTIPIYPGILPITGVKSLYRMTNLCGASIPADLYDRLQRYVDNDECMLEVGLNHAASQIDDLIAHGVPGIHIYSMNRADVLDGLFSRIKCVLLEEQMK